MIQIPGRSLFALFLLLSCSALSAQEKRAMTVADIMKFEPIKSQSISQDGHWVVHDAVPDRGDPRTMVYSTDGEKIYEMAGAKSPVISGNGAWVAAQLSVPASELLVSNRGKDEGPKTGLILLNTSSGKQSTYADVRSFSFSNDSKWLATLKHDEKENKSKSKDKDKKHVLKEGTSLNLLDLEGDSQRDFSFVTSYAFDSLSQHLAFVVVDTGNGGNGVYVLDLSDSSSEPFPVFADSSAWGSNLSWNHGKSQLAFLAGIADKKGEKKMTELRIWEEGKAEAPLVLNDEKLEDGWLVWHTNSLHWSLDGLRLFLGIKPESEIIPPEEEKADSLKNLYSKEDILAEKTVDVWHWEDPYINPQQKIRWKQEKDRTYTGVYYPQEDRFVPLANPEMPSIHISENTHTVLGSTPLPYARMATWDSRYNDYYLVDLKTGKKKLVLEKLQGRPSLSPDGKFLAWYDKGDWQLRNVSSGEIRNLTADLSPSFADEDWDYPAATPGYGLADWQDASKAVWIYDKYDVWSFPTDGGLAINLTEGKGRAENLQFRIRKLDRELKFVKSGESLFLSAYHDFEKYTALYSMKAGRPGVSPLSEGAAKYTLIARAKDADKLLYSRQTYTEFPDLWVSGFKFRKTKKLSALNPDREEIAWGQAELVEWSSIDGTPLQGILIKPDNYEAGKKYPVLVYYYRFFSQRLYDFNRVELTHRPCFPYYASNGYAIFLPDIRFDVGNPGYSATKCLVPGVQKLIDEGIADPEAICLHGHSWSGYQTAFAITQTNLFTCAIAGAPVSNMTSAYSGIRWGSGLARQFQYEKTQSRIGGSLWEARDLYIENSPVFFADRIETPLLIMFGDIDDAVPWYQGIELYLAMRRLGKDCIFLQYRDEPHHPKKYANKLDCTLRYKEYLDHYLKKEAPADWVKNGIPYTGK